MHGTRTAVLGPRTVMLIAVRRRVCKVALLRKMHGVLEQLTQPWSDCPEK